MTPAEIIAAYDKLLARAIKLSEGSCWKSDYARLTINENGALLTWPENETSYGETTMEAQHFAFDLAFLDMSNAEIDAELKDWRRQREAEAAERRASEARQREQARRAEYERLRREFGDT